MYYKTSTIELDLPANDCGAIKNLNKDFKKLNLQEERTLRDWKLKSKFKKSLIYQKSDCWEAEECVVHDGRQERDLGRGRVADPVEGTDGHTQRWDLKR